MNDTPQAPQPQRTTSAWTRRIVLTALVVLLILSALRLVNALLQNTDSLVFQGVPRFPWDILVYSAFQFVLVLIVLIVVDRELRVRRPLRRLVSSPRAGPQPVKAQAPAPAPPPRPAKPKKPEPVYYTITGEELNPTEQEGDSSTKK